MKNNFVSDTRTLKLRGYVEVFKGKPKWVKQVWTKCFLAHLAQKCPQLKKLCLVEANIDQSVIMTDLPISVCVLQLCSCHISHGQRFFRVPPRQKIQLIELDLSNSVGVSDAALGHIANLETLRVLRLYNCQVVKDSGLQYFADHLTNLQCLNLGRTFITDTSLHLLSQHHTKLTELTLINCHVTRNGIMDLISSLKSLKTLNMQLTLVNEEEMTSVIERFPLVTIVCK